MCSERAARESNVMEAKWERKDGKTVPERISPKKSITSNNRINGKEHRIFEFSMEKRVKVFWGGNRIRLGFSFHTLCTFFTCRKIAERWEKRAESRKLGVADCICLLQDFIMFVECSSIKYC